MTAAPADLAQVIVEAARRVAAARRSVPLATYRLQMNAGFTFRDARRVVPYLHALGISHLYLSPIFAARAGSPHGYDVTDPTRFNPEIGTEAEFRALVAAAREHSMGIILDVVPNHMAVDPANPWWRDVLEHGPASPYAGYFDIAWDDPPRPELRGRVMLPILGSPYDLALQNDDLTLAFENGAFAILCHGRPFPVDPRTYDRLLGPALDLAKSVELRDILTVVTRLPPRSEPDPERNRLARIQADAIRERLAALVATNPAAASAIRQVVARHRCNPDDPVACDRLDGLLEAQAYRLCFWRVASDEINYRRFFDVNELVALAAEREDVFRDTHALLLRLAGEGLIDGVRIDHPDGLFDPKQYLERLQQGYLLACAKHVVKTDAAFKGVEWGGVEREVIQSLRRDESAMLQNPPLYVVVEKILDRSESLPNDWPTAGATGYEFLNAVTGLFIDPAGERTLTRTYEAFTGRDEPFSEVAFRSKLQVLSTSFAGELDMLARRLDRIARSNRRARDFTLNGLRQALRTVIACFPVYRSYLPDGVSAWEKHLMVHAIREARRRDPTLNPDLFTFIRDTLLGRTGTGSEDQRVFAGRFEQLTAPVAAKGVEDTAFYVYNRLLALNEVGGDPAQFCRSPAELHRYFAERQAKTPGALNAGSTHDAKRGEDVRARLAVLSEWPDEWTRRVTRWAEWNRPHRIDLGDGFFAPDPNDEYLLYQTLVGAWPIDADRLIPYAGKAIHEAKIHTSWINPNQDYDRAVPEFIERILDPRVSQRFLEDLEEFAAMIANVGAINSLSQTVLRCMAPGVPDTYQGTELWDLNLVDPDNRQPVDFALRVQSLAEQHFEVFDERTKLAVLAQLLQARRKQPELFRHGEYVPIEVAGRRSDHVFAFVRRFGREMVLAAVPRFVVKLFDHTGRADGGDTVIKAPPAVWRNLLTGQRFSTVLQPLTVSALFERFPVAVLVPHTR